MIEVVDESNLEELLPLMRDYQQFYNVPVVASEQNIEAKNRAFFAQFCAGNEKGCLFLYRHLGKAVAFATVYFSFSSTITAKVAVMNDLYTAPQIRGQGIGRALIEHCRAYGSEHGAARLQWVTAADNTTAQALYDSLDGVKRSSWEFYVATG